MNRVATAAIMLAVVAGPPVAALWVMSRSGWRIPTAGDVQAWWNQPLTPGTVIAAVAAIAAFGWLALSIAVIRHAATRARTRWDRMRRLPMPSPAQVTATSMAGVAALTVPTPDTAATPTPVIAGAGHPLFSLEDAAPSPAPQSPAAGEQTGISLPGGGWIPYRTGLAVATITAAVWLHRRHQYRPGPPRPGTHLHDPDLDDLPASTQVIDAALADSPPPADFDLTHKLLLPSHLPDGHLRLDGPGAAAAARGLVVTVVLNNALNPDTPQTLRIRRADLHRLLPEIDPDTLAAYGIRAGRTAAVAGSHVHDQAVPEAVEPSLITTIELGGPQHGTESWHAGTDGITTTPDGTRRLSVLDERTATDLLTLVDHLHPGELAPTAPAPAATTAQTSPPRPGTPGFLQLLGGWTLTIHGQPVQLRRTAGQQLLAYLAVHSDGATSADLARTLWPGLPTTATTGRLYTTVTDLRRQLQPLLGGDPVVRRDDRYHLNTTAISTDLTILKQAIAAAANASTPGQRHAVAETLADAYPGELADGYRWPWLYRHREAMNRDVLDAYQQLAATADPAELAALLDGGTNRDHHRELRRRAAQALHRPSNR